jgi:tRNA dimethylallyltransferase
MKVLIALFGPTASGKTALSIVLAQRFGAEILSCDSVAVYRGMEVGTAKPTLAERRLVPHHCLDLYDPDEACTAGDYARHARATLADLAERGVLPILSGGTGLYARALLDGLFPAPAKNAELRALLRTRVERRGAVHLHRTLARLDAVAAEAIHPNDVSKVIRAIEVSVAARQPMSAQWAQGRDGLGGYRILRLGLDVPREELYARINRRAGAMFAAGLIEETRSLIERFGADCRPFESLGYAQASAVLAGRLREAEAVAQTAQGHRNYAKRQMTWFRREAQLHEVHWLRGAGDAAEIIAEAEALVESHLAATVAAGSAVERPDHRQA